MGSLARTCNGGVAGTRQPDRTKLPGFGQPGRSEIDRCQVFAEAVVRSVQDEQPTTTCGWVLCESKRGRGRKGEVKRLRDRKETPGTPEFKVERRNANFDASRGDRAACAWYNQISRERE